jgi:hypothetical protein
MKVLEFSLLLLTLLFLIIRTPIASANDELILGSNSNSAVCIPLTEDDTDESSGLLAKLSVRFLSSNQVGTDIVRAVVKIEDSQESNLIIEKIYGSKGSTGFSHLCKWPIATIPGEELFKKKDKQAKYSNLKWQGDILTFNYLNHKCIVDGISQDKPSVSCATL